MAQQNRFDPKKLPIPQTELSINYKSEESLHADINNIVADLFVQRGETIECKITTIQGGITNLLFLAELNTNDPNIPKDLLIRVYGENTEVLIDRPFETCLFHELGQSGFGPKVL